MIFNLFKKKKIKASNDDLLLDSNFIIFSLKESETEPIIKIKCGNTSNNDAHNFGLLLYLIHSGLTQSTVLELLADISKQNPEANIFIQEVLSKWILESNNKNTQDNNPVVKPTSFNKSAELQQ